MGGGGVVERSSAGQRVIKGKRKTSGESLTREWKVRATQDMK